MLLKATHMPFIAAIWAYEHFAGQKQNSGVVSISGPETPGNFTRTVRPWLNPSGPSKAGFPAFGEGNGLSQGRLHLAHRPHTRAGPSETEVQLKPLVLKLTAQVEELTAMVSQLQKQSEAGKAA